MLHRESFLRDYDFFWSLSPAERPSVDGSLVALIFVILAMGTRKTTPAHYSFVQADREHRDNVSVLSCSPRKDKTDLENITEFVRLPSSDDKEQTAEFYGMRCCTENRVDSDLIEKFRRHTRR